MGNRSLFLAVFAIVFVLVMRSFSIFVCFCSIVFVFIFVIVFVIVFVMGSSSICVCLCSLCILCGAAPSACPGSPPREDSVAVTQENIKKKLEKMK